MKTTIIIGKEGNQKQVITEPTVSRRHAVLEIEENHGLLSKMILRDTNSANGTYIMKKDGSAEKIIEKIVNGNMIVRLGPTYTIKVDDLIPDVIRQVDISALKHLSDFYYKRKLELDQKQATNQKLQMLTPVISICGMALGPVLISSISEDAGLWMKAIPAVAVLLLFGVLFYFLLRQSRAIITEKNQLDYNFKKNYSCPNCHYAFGNAVYESLLGSMCPKCKKMLIEKSEQI